MFVIFRNHRIKTIFLQECSRCPPYHERSHCCFLTQVWQTCQYPPGNRWLIVVHPLGWVKDEYELRLLQLIQPFSHTWTLVSHINDAGFLIPWRAPVRADMNLPPPQAFNVSKPNWRRRSSFPMRLMAGLDIADRRCSPVSLRFYVPGAQPYTARLHPGTLGCSGAPLPSGGLYRTWNTTCLNVHSR